MNPRRTFGSIALGALLLIASCGDKLVVPADKTGECVKGLLTKCNKDCVDLQSNLSHCGACGTACNVAKGEVCASGKCSASCPPGSTRCNDTCVDVTVDRLNCGMCGTSCAINELCIKGKCAATCEAAGYLTCAGAMSTLDAGGAASCVDPKTDNGNCGACGNVCAGMLKCSNGTCCNPAETGCGGKCVDTLADPNNCGGCGVVCPMAAPNCVSGACSKCKPEVLILADPQTAINTNMKNAFIKAGFRPTVIDDGSRTYQGMPPATDFSAVMVIRGSIINGTDMPANGQQAIVSAQAAGTGVVIDCFVPLENVNGNRLALLKPFHLQPFSGSLQGGGTVATVGNPQPFFAGTPTSFGIANATYWTTNTQLMNNGQSFANFINGPAYIGGTFRASPNGRIVQFAYAVNFQGAASQWTNDVNMTQWTINGVRYAAGCTM